MAGDWLGGEVGEEIEIREELPVLVQVVELLDQVLRSLRELKDEVRKLATQDAALTQVVIDLNQAYTDDFNALEAQVTALTTAQANGDDPAEDAAVASLQTLVGTMKTNTAAATAAIAALTPPAAPASAPAAAAEVPAPAAS
jgi:hypothetical protein